MPYAALQNTVEILAGGLPWPGCDGGTLTGSVSGHGLNAQLKITREALSHVKEGDIVDIMLGFGPPSPFTNPVFWGRVDAIDPASETVSVVGPHDLLDKAMILPGEHRPADLADLITRAAALAGILPGAIIVTAPPKQVYRNTAISAADFIAECMSDWDEEHEWFVDPLPGHQALLYMGTPVVALGVPPLLQAIDEGVLLRRPAKDSRVISRERLAKPKRLRADGIAQGAVEVKQTIWRLQTVWGPFARLGQTVTCALDDLRGAFTVVEFVHDLADKTTQWTLIPEGGA